MLIYIVCSFLTSKLTLNFVEFDNMRPVSIVRLWSGGLPDQRRIRLSNSEKCPSYGFSHGSWETNQCCNSGKAFVEERRGWNIQLNRSAEAAGWIDTRHWDSRLVAHTDTNFEDMFLALIRNWLWSVGIFLQWLATYSSDQDRKDQKWGDNYSSFTPSASGASTNGVNSRYQWRCQLRLQASLKNINLPLLNQPWWGIELGSNFILWEKMAWFRTFSWVLDR